MLNIYQILLTSYEQVIHINDDKYLSFGFAPDEQRVVRLGHVEAASRVCGVLSVVEVLFPGFPLIMHAFACFASSSMSLSSSFVQICIEHLTVRGVSSHSDVVFTNH